MKPEAAAEAPGGGVIEPAAGPVKKAQTPFQRLVADFFESKVAVFGLAITTCVVFIAIFAPWISPTNPFDLAKVDIMDNLLPPGGQNFAGDFTYVLGTDGSGRDMLSAIFFGLRTSISVGVTSGVVALAIGMSIGLTAAYFGGIVDTVIMRVVDIQLSFPAILIALVLMAVLGPGIDKTILALIVAQWAYYARTIRGSALVERRKEYIEAATCLALSHRRIVFRHLLPNCLPPLIVVATVQTAHAISLEATLSFLGLGVPQTEPSLGMLIRNGFDYMHSLKYWITFFPGIALLVTIVGINLVGDQLRDILNPRLQK
jgi:peptide/nickel transport system permease protein